MKEKFPNVKPSAKINDQLGALPDLIFLVFGLMYTQTTRGVTITFSNYYCIYYVHGIVLADRASFGWEWRTGIHEEK